MSEIKSHLNSSHAKSFILSGRKGIREFLMDRVLRWAISFENFRFCSIPSSISMRKIIIFLMLAEVYGCGLLKISSSGQSFVCFLLLHITLTADSSDLSAGRVGSW